MLRFAAVSRYLSQYPQPRRAELASVPLIRCLAIAQAICRIRVQRLGDIAQRNAVTHRESPLTNHVPGICTENGHAENPSVAIGENFDQPTCVLVRSCPIDLV